MLDIPKRNKTKVHRKSLTINDLRRGAARRAKSLIVNDLSVRFKAGIVPKKPRQGRENLDGVVSERGSFCNAQLSPLPLYGGYQTSALRNFYSYFVFR